ncbi:unnamed protein product [Diabrotica balteata]|uniref:Syndecan n=1 Tax=Diabrotica balteata TaxID=107213 RepID=A0A9N9SQF8_DIABA|nr:unnamed protein product [Diabrotica balteata]
MLRAASKSERLNIIKIFTNEVSTCSLTCAVDANPMRTAKNNNLSVVGGAVVGLLCAILVVMFIVYRMRKKDEGSYAVGDPKQSPNSNSYSRATTNKEFFA